MRNRLNKEPEVEYIPAVLAQPPRAAYSYTSYSYQTVRTGGSGGSTQSVTGTDRNLASPTYGQSITITQHTPGTGGTSQRVRTGRTVRVPARPGVPGVPAKANYYANNGWNGGARSINPVPSNGYAEASLPPSPAGIMLGLCQGEFYSNYTQPALAMVARPSGVTPVAAGMDLAPEGGQGSLLRFERIKGRVRMLVDGVLVHETDDPFDGPVFLASMLYALSDHVFDPLVGALHVADPVAVDVGVRALFRADPRGTAEVGVKLSGLASVGGVFHMRGQADVGVAAAGVATAEHWVKGQAEVGVSAAADRYGMFGVESPVTHGMQGYCDGRLVIRGAVGNANASKVSGFLPAATLEARSGRPELMITQVAGHLPPMTLSAHAVSGEASSVSGELALVGKATDAPFCGVDAVAAIRYQLTHALSHTPEGIIDGAEPVLAWDSMSLSAAALFAMYDGVAFSDSIDLYLLLDLSMYEMISIGDTASFSGVLQLIMQERLALADSGERSRREAIQYAVNAVAGALSRYSNFGFKQFATAGGHTYAITDDGLFRLTGDNDDGETLNASIDFGASDYGAAQSKRVSSVYAGIATDGCVYFRVTGDGGREQIYRAADGANERRALTAKGVVARHWRIRLELMDASYADLDNLEVEVGVSQRRLRR